MSRIRYEIENYAPLVISTENGSQDMVATLRYIPGNILLGFFANRYNGTRPLEQDQGFHRLFLSGRVIFQAAFLTQSGTTSDRKDKIFYPTPLAFVRNDTYQEQIDNALFVKPPVKPQKIADFALVEGECIYLTSPQTRYHFHRKQNISDRNNIFNYEALTEGQKFSGYILGEDCDLAAIMAICGAEFSMSIGRSRTTQYGGSRVTLRMEADELSAVQEEDDEQEEEYQCLLYFTTPAVLYNEHGMPEASGSCLESYLVASLGEKSFALINQRLAYTTVESYRGVWRMKRPALAAIAARSSLLLLFKEKQAAQTARRIWQTNGIGELCHEGLGMVQMIMMPSEKYQEKEFLTQKALQPTDAASLALKNLYQKYLIDCLEKMIKQRALDDVQTEVKPVFASHHIVSRLVDILESINHVGEFPELIAKTMSKNGKNTQELHTILIKKQGFFDYIKDEQPYKDYVGNFLNKRIEVIRALHLLSKQPTEDDDFLTAFLQQYQDRFYKLYWRSFFDFAARSTAAAGRSKP